MWHVIGAVLGGVIAGAGLAELVARHFERRYRKLFGFKK